MPQEIHRSHLADLDIIRQAKGLLGALVVSEIGGQRSVARIVETEAYRGADDKAAHSYGYKRTNRTEVFFGQPGHAYVYLIYGMHRMFNVICGPENEPNAVLIRAVEPIEGISFMQMRRGISTQTNRISNGPGILCQALGISLDHNGCDLFNEASPMRLAGLFSQLSPKQILSSPRVGVGYAEECAAWNWRFRESGNPWTSPAK